MIVKSYTLSNQNLIQLHNEIKAANLVVNFAGVEGAGSLNILGDSILDEAALDALISNHVPLYVPAEVTPRQMRLALVFSGISLSTIDAIIDSLPEPTKSAASITWEYSNEIQRTNPLVLSLAPALGLTVAQIDQLFITAGGL